MNIVRNSNVGASARRQIPAATEADRATTLAIPVVGSHLWHGGVIYVHLMATALRSLPAEKQPRLVFLVRRGEEGNLDLYRPFLSLFDGVVLVGFPAHETPDVAGVPIVRADTIAEAHDHFDVLYPMRPQVMPGVRGASWIPDFQHRHLPRFFSPQELAGRDAEFGEVARASKICVFSSLDAEKDFKTFYPDSQCKTHILHFFHQLPEAAFQQPVEPVVAKYELRRKFIFCCNQFWIHKGHDTLFPAFARLAEEFPDIDLVCTGSTEDYRTADHFRNLVAFLRSNGLESRVKILGLIPREDQLQLLRASMGVVHPSRFEGWSTVVEDCRSLGKRMVLSDLGVHLEQDPPGAVYFRTGDEDDLVSKMRATLPTWTPGPDPVAEATARSASERNIRGYGEELLALCGKIKDAFGGDQGAMRCLEEAADRLVKNRPSEVEAALDRTPLLESNDARIQRAAGNLLLRAGLLNKARAKFLLSTRLDPNDAQAHLDLAVTWLMLARYSEAEAAARRTLELDPRNGPAWKTLGQIHLRNTDKSAGVEAYRKALDFLPDDPECLVVVGAWHGQRGEVSQSRSLLEKAMRLCPNDPGIRVELDKLPRPAGHAVLAPSTSSKAPLVSAIVSTYKSEGYLRGCLQDLVDQTLFSRGELEIVVVDSASPEREGDIVREFQARHPDIRYIRTAERETLYAAWNRGIRAARGRYVTNANTDDAHRADALEILAAALEANPETDLVFADCIWTDRANDTWDNTTSLRKVISYLDYHPASCLFWCTLGPHPMWRTTVFERVGWFDPAYKAAGDLEFQVRFTFHGAKAVHVPIPLSLFFQNAKGLTFQDSTSGLEAAEVFETARQIVPLDKLYGIDTNDRKAVAEAWIALAHRSLQFQIPWASVHAVPEFGLECFQRALYADPGNDYAYAGVVELAKALGRTQDIPERQATLGPLQPKRPAEPRPFAEPIRWEPSVRSIPGRAISKAPGAGESTAIRWCGGLFNFSGYARLAREAVTGLMDGGRAITADPLLNDKNWFTGIAASDRSRWTDLLSRAPEPGVLVCCDVPRDAKGNELFEQMEAANPGCSKRVGWTMFETDRLPVGWADSLNRLDEVWVPSEFNRRTFTDAGVRADKLHVVPGSVDPAPYLSALPFPLSGPSRGTTFLSVFQWTRRKGWDVLLSAWAKAFDPKADVRLVLRCHPFERPASEMRDIFRQSLEELGLRESDLAPVVLLDDFVPEAAMPALFAACDVFVLPSRGEGWGLPYLEAMAAGKPCIATAWGASLAFLHDGNSWLAAPREIVPVGDAACRENLYLSPEHRWADPDPGQVSQLLRRAASNVDERMAKGRQARQDALSRWTPSHTANAIALRLAALGSASPRVPPSTLGTVSGGRLSSSLEKVAAGLRTTSASVPVSKTESVLSVRWEGSQFVHHSLAHVNRALCLRLAKMGHDLSILPWEPDQFAPGEDPDLAVLAKLHKAPLDGPCQVHVRQTWPPVLEAPAQGKWVVVQPWEFGSPPVDWIVPFRDRVDEIWAYTEYVKRVYVEAGIPENQVRVVPLGVDTEIFRPGLVPLPGLERDDRLTFLFVGGTIARKGFDVLLNAWRQAFGPSDRVRLVVKAMGGDTFYKGQTGETMVQELNASGRSAPVVYFDQDLSPSDLPRIYASGDVLVHPYRGEGFGLPIAEAMASGLPVVVTRGGAADDFCGDDESWGISAMRVPVPGGKVGEFSTVAPPWWLEPSVDDLAETLRQVAKDEAGRNAKGEAARKRILSGWTWGHAAHAVESALRDVAAIPVARREASSPNATRLQAPRPAQDAASEKELADLNRILFRAEAAAARGELTEAESATQEAVEAHPDQPLAWLARAMILRGLKKLPAASQAVRKSIALKESPDALLESVMVHKLSGQDAHAKAAEKTLKGAHGAWLAATRALYKSKGQAWPLDAPSKSAAKSVAPPLKGRH